jgi:PBP4 family serine-type D-alanyl-D-alanine carboxypeptidase
VIGLAPAALALAINAPTRTTRLKNSIVAGEVYDLDSHRVLYARNANVLMVAASTTKLLTEGTSLALLGPGFRWTTPVYRTGQIDARGVLDGDLVLVASGDPNLSQRVQPNGTLAFENEDHAYDGSPETKAVPGDPLAVLRDLAAQVVKAGIKQIDGTVHVDTSLFPDQGAEGGTGVVVSPIVVNDNIVDVTVTPAARPGDPVSISASPQTPYVKFVNRATTGSRGSDATIDLSSDVKTGNQQMGEPLPLYQVVHTVTITGSQPVGPPVLYAYRVPEPLFFAQAAFTVALKDAGIAFDPPDLIDVAPPCPGPRQGQPDILTTYSPAHLVAQHVSPPLSEDVYITLKVSDNLHATLMPYMWAVYLARATKDYLTAGFALEARMLRGAGLDVDQASQQDGEGGSAFFTPDFMVRYLAWARTQSWYRFLLRGLPIMGVDGTLVGIQRASPARGKVFAKTGTDGSTNYLNNGGIVEKGLAGYITTRGGRHVAFAFYISAMNGPHDEDTGALAGQILGAMASAVYEEL